MNLDFISAFMIGIFGSSHCLVMCGGICTMLTSAISNKPQQRQHLIVLAYHIGRITSYSTIGAIVAFTSSMAAKNIGFPLIILKFISGIFLILLGCYLARWLMWLNYVEHIGKIIWRHLSPKTKKFIPIKNIKGAFSLGILWGWLPCGLVYSTLTWALASADIMQGALIMFFFGLGTLPALFFLSIGTLNIQHLFNNHFFKNITASLLILYGIYTIVVAYQ